MKIGYCRVSTHEQNIDLQTDALKAAGCDKFFTDKGISGAIIRARLNQRMDNGMQAARRRGKSLGRPKALSTEKNIHAKRTIDSGAETIAGMVIPCNPPVFKWSHE